MKEKEVLKNKVEASNNLINLLQEIKQPLIKYLLQNAIKFTKQGYLYKKNRKEIEEILDHATGNNAKLKAYLSISSWNMGEYISGVVYLKVKTMYQTSEETVNYIEKSQRIWDIDAKRPTLWFDWENRKTTVKEQENYLSILEDVRAKQRRLETKNREYKNLLIWEE